MHIQQLQISFDAREDRLLLRIATAEREEIRVALTRRLVKALWPQLQRMLTGHLATESEEPDTIEMQDALAAPAAPASAADAFAESFEGEKRSHPLGKTPLLAMESRLQAIDGPACRIMLGEIRARKVSFECDRDLLLALCAMIRATVDKADWNLDLDALTRAAETAAPDVAPTLH